MRRPSLSIFLVVCLLASASAGCTIGYRYHHLDTEIADAAGANAQLEGSGHTVELGIVLDFRYFRFVTPYLGSTYEMDIADTEGGAGHQSSTEEVRAVRLDVPLISLWSPDGGIGYPGTMVHRQSVEVWTSVTGRATELPLWYADVGLVYYHHDAAAVRLFGGYGAVPFDGHTARTGLDGADYRFWRGSPKGYTGGVELTVGAGEQALDFLKFFANNQEEAGKPPK